MVYLLNFRDLPVGGKVSLRGRLSLLGAPPVPEQVALDKEQVALEKLALESEVTFLIHGFNNNQINGQAKLEQLAGSLKSTQGKGVVAVLWPGDHGWLGPLSYPMEGVDADATADSFSQFISLYIRPGTRVCFVTHSMGARVAMETIKQLRSKYGFSQVCLMAAAIDDDSLSCHNVYRNATLAVDRLTVLSSEKDSVLALAYPLGDFLQSVFFFETDTDGLALGLSGPRSCRACKGPVPSNVYAHPISRSANVGHSDYVTNGIMRPTHIQTAAFVDEVLSGVSVPVW